MTDKVKPLDIRDLIGHLNRKDPRLYQALTNLNQYLNSIHAGTALDIPVDTGGGGTGETGADPGQLMADDWLLDFVGYEYDEDHQIPLQRNRVTILVNNPDTVFYSFFRFKGTVAPTDESTYEDVGDQLQAASGSTTFDILTPRPDTGTDTYKVKVTASTATFQSFPTNVTTSAAKTFTVNHVAPPAQVTGFSVTVLVDVPSQTGRLKYDLTPPSDPEYFSDNIYRTQMSDNTFTTPVGPQTLVANTINGYTQSLDESFPLADASYWQFESHSVARAKIAGVNVENFVSPPISNLSVPAFASGSAGAPPQPVSGDFAVSIFSNGFDDARNVAISTPQAVVANGTSPGATDFTVWSYEGSGAPPTVDQWKFIGNYAINSSGSTQCLWNVDRFKASKTYQITVTAAAGGSTPPSVSSPIHAITITPPTTPSQVSSFVVVPIRATNGGVDSGKLEYDFFVPNDPEIAFVRIQRVECDSFFTPLSGKTFQDVAQLGIVPAQLGTSVSFLQQDWWVWIDGTSYWKFQATTVSRAHIENFASIPFYNLGMTASSGLDARKFDPATFNGAEFHIDPITGRFTMNSIDFSKATNFSAQFVIDPTLHQLTIAQISANLIITGLLQVGGGTNRVSVMKFFTTDFTPVLYGWIGDDRVTGANPAGSGFVGAWFQRILLGGTSPASAQVIIDNFGNATFNGSLGVAVTLSVSKLTAGTANFGGDVIFQRTGGTSSMTLNAAGVQLKNSSGIGGVVIDQSGGVSIRDNIGNQTIINGGLIVGQTISLSSTVVAVNFVISIALGAGLFADTVKVVNNLGQLVGPGAALTAACGAVGFNMTNGSGAFVGTAIDSSFNFQVRGQLRLTTYILDSVTYAGWNGRFPVYNATGGLLGYSFFL